MSTLKSPLSRGSDAPHVHQRLRKHLARCTLDCGFKTSESPALRGFVGGLRALATAALYLVLKSNGLPRPKIRLKKFGFSLKIVPATIAKKLPPQRCSQPFLIPIFNFSHKRHTFAFAGESGYTTRLSAKDRTQRLTRQNRGLPSLVHSVVLCCRRYPFYSTTLLYTYISRFSVNPQHQQKRIIRQSCHHKFYPQPLFNFSYNRPTFAFTSESGYALAFAQRIAHNGSHGETRGVSDGALLLPSERSTRFGNPAWPGFKTANFAAFGSWSETLLKNAESLRNSDALMRVAVPRRRGPAGLRGLFSFLTKLRLVRPIPETSFSSPDAPACAVPAQAAFPLALSRLGAVQGFSVLSLCLTPFLDFEDKKRPLTIRIVRPVNGLIFDVHFLCSVQQTGICRIFTSLLPAPSGRLHKGRTES